MDSFFSRVRFITSEISSAVLAAGTRSIGIERARTECNLRLMERNCDDLGKLLSQALEMQMILSRQIAKEPRADVVDIRFMRG